MFKKRSSVLDEVMEMDFFKKDRFGRYFELVIGVILNALAFNLFMFPHKIISGFSGIAIILNEMFNIDAFLIILILTVLLLIIGLFTLGEDKIKLTIVGALLYPLFVKITEPLVGYIIIDNPDSLLSVLFGGFLYGIGSGLIFRAGFSTGGSDTVVQIISKYLKVSLGKANLYVNVVIIIAGVFTFGLTMLMYSLLFLYIVSIVMDRIILGISSAKAFYIITDREEEIKTYIMKKLGRGVTMIEARGGFSNNKEKILMCIIPTSEYFILQEAVSELDKQAVLLVTDVYQAKGNR